MVGALCMRLFVFVVAAARGSPTWQLLPEDHQVHAENKHGHQQNGHQQQTHTGGSRDGSSPFESQPSDEAPPPSTAALLPDNLIPDLSPPPPPPTEKGRSFLWQSAHGVYLSSYAIGEDSRTSTLEGTVVGRPWFAQYEHWAVVPGSTDRLSRLQDAYGNYLGVHALGEDSRSDEHEGTAITLELSSQEALRSSVEWVLTDLSDDDCQRNASWPTGGRAISIMNANSSCYLSAYGIGDDERSAPLQEATVVCRPWARGQESWLLGGGSSRAMA